ncbi:FAR1 DNA-binding domain protein [Arachis hypogaea]|nr:FAR1 DNA-binding domain protein [Arachis hypogaea]
MVSSSRSMERRVTGDKDIPTSVHLANEAYHGVGSVEGEGFVRMESDEYELHEDETEHDHLGEADGDNGDRIELEDNLDGVGGMYDNFADDDLCAVDSGESIGSIDFVNLSREEVCRFNFANIDIAFEFYQAYAKHHDFSGRRSRSKKCGEIRIR